MTARLLIVAALLASVPAGMAMAQPAPAAGTGTSVAPVAGTPTTGTPVATPAPDASATIDAFNRALVASAGTGRVQRAAALLPVVRDTFNVSVMARFIVGPGWEQMSAADKGAIEAALRRYLAMRFAHDFSLSAKTRVSLDPHTEMRGADKVVTTIIADPGDNDPDRVLYRMRAYQGQWKAIDIIYDGISELTTRRADLASVAGSGAAALVARIEASTGALSR